MSLEKFQTDMITIQEVRSEEEIEKDLNMILRQTDYTREEAKKKLEDNDYDVMKTIKDYMLNGKESELEKIKTKTKSTNQILMKELRVFMDDVNTGFNKRQIEKAKEMSKEKKHEEH